MARLKVYRKRQYLISGLEVEVLHKNVKNLNLRVDTAQQRVRLSVPKRIPDQAVFEFIEQKMPWIKRHLKRKRSLKKKPSLNFESGEYHFLWGKEYMLKVVEAEKPPRVHIEPSGTLILQVRPGATKAKRASVLKEFRREQIKEAIPKLIDKWEATMGVDVWDYGVKQMKTRWGTCNIRDHRIWLNLELAKKRPELLEYVVIHEMVHLLERLHNKRFYAHMSRFLPQWKKLKDELNGRSSFADC